MKITTITLPKSQQFCIPVSRIKTVFSNFEDLSVHFGTLRKHFRFDSRCYNRPKLKGPVVASLSVPRVGSQVLSLYAVARADYSKFAAVDFETVYVHKMSQWLKSKLQRRETEILGVDELIVEWAGALHCVHEVRFL